MKVFWDGHDAQAWDQAHGRLAGALQQDWAYGETMMALGVACLRARVERDGRGRLLLGVRNLTSVAVADVAVRVQANSVSLH